MEHLRLATPEEVAEIQKDSDITPRSMVFCLDQQKAVLRNVFELDPYWIGNATKGQATKFFWGLEERLLGMGIDAYYFMIDDGPETEEWRKTVEHWGAEGTTAKPSFRYKRKLS